MQIAGKQVVVTGAGGFIGAALVRRFVALGATVRGFDLSPAAAATIRAAGGEPIVGDVTSADDAKRACAGVDLVLHTAAVVGEGGDRALYERVNVGGTENVAHAARGARFLHLSSVMVHGFDYPADVTEDGPLDGNGNDYNETKIASERRILALGAAGVVSPIVVRPGDVYGPGSQPWVVRPIEMMKKRMFAVPSRGAINHVHVDNLIDGVVRAIERDLVGEVVTITDGVATPCRDYFGHLARMLGRRGVLVLPAGPMRRAFSVIERACDRLHVTPPARVSAVDFLTRPHRYSIAKAERLLDYRPRVGLQEGMRGVERWLRETGRI